MFLALLQTRRFDFRWRPIKKKKRGESLSVTRPTQRGLRITQYSKTSNANTHAHVIYIAYLDCTYGANVIHLYNNTS